MAVFNLQITINEVSSLTLGAHAQRELQYSVCVCVCVCVRECVCYLAINSYTVIQVQSKIRIKSKINAVQKIFDWWISLTFFKSYGVICSPQRTLTVSTASRRLEDIGRLAAISNAVTHDD